jgi:hypothetical protein
MLLLEILAQATTYPSTAPTTLPIVIPAVPVVPAGGMSNWGVAEWSVFITLLVTSLTGLLTAITAGIISIMKAVKAGTDATSALKGVDDLKTDLNARASNLASATRTAQAAADQALLHTKPPTLGSPVQVVHSEGDLPNDRPKS